MKNEVAKYDKIKSRFREVHKKDSAGLFSENRKSHERYMKRVKDPRYLIGVYLEYLRKKNTLKIKTGRQNILN